MDIIFVRGLTIATRIGIHEWEQDTEQAVVLDLDMGVDSMRAAATDRIEDALDYEAVATRLKRFIGENRFALVETLAESCVEILQREFSVPWVRLRVNKPGALPDAIEVGVVIERGNADEPIGALGPGSATAKPT